MKKYQLPLRIAIVFDNTVGFDKSFIMETDDVWREIGGLDHDVR